MFGKGSVAPIETTIHSISSNIESDKAAFKSDNSVEISRPSRPASSSVLGFISLGFTLPRNTSLMLYLNNLKRQALADKLAAFVDKNQQAILLASFLKRNDFGFNS